MPLIFTGGVNLSGAVEATGSGYVPPPPPPYFIAQGPTNGVSEGRSVALDSSGNMYAVGSLDGDINISLARYSRTTGGVVWQYKIDSTFNDSISSIYTDSSDNIFVAGRVDGSGFSGASPEARSWLAKFNTSGTVIWQTRIAAISYGSVINQVVTDSSGDVVICGYSGTPNGFVAKLNSSGVIQWIKTTGTNSGITGVATDSSNNRYLIGQSAAHPPSPGVVMKLNSSGTQQWAKTWAGNSEYANYAGGIAVSASGSVYASFSANNSDAYLVKLSAADGSQSWQRKLNGGTNEYGSRVAVDSTENIYWLTSVLTNYSGAVGFQNQKAVMIKYNSSGSQQWQRHMFVSGTSYPNAFDYLNSMIVDTSGNFYVTGRMNSTNILAKLPGDGSLTTATSYTVNGKPIVYATSAITESAGDISIGTGGSYIGVGSASQTTPNYTPTSTAFTVTTVVIG